METITQRFYKSKSYRYFFCLKMYKYWHSQKTCLSFINTSVWPSIYLGPRQRVGGALLFLACPSICLSICPSVHLSVFSAGVVTLTFQSDFFQTSYMDCFHELWFKFKYRFFPTNDNQDGRQNGRRLSVYIHRGHFYFVTFNWFFQISYIVCFH